MITVFTVGDRVRSAVINPALSLSLSKKYRSANLRKIDFVTNFALISRNLDSDDTNYRCELKLLKFNVFERDSYFFFPF